MQEILQGEVKQFLARKISSYFGFAGMKLVEEISQKSISWLRLPFYAVRHTYLLAYRTPLHSIRYGIVVGADGKTPLPASVWPKIESIRRIVLDTVAELAQPEASFLFTNELYEGKSRDRRWDEDVALLATKRNALLVPVILRCEPEELYRRVTSPERAMRFKETSTDRTRENIRTYQLLRIDHPNRLELDITHLLPIQAAQAILAHVEKRTIS